MRSVKNSQKPCLAMPIDICRPCGDSDGCSQTFSLSLSCMASPDFVYVFLSCLFLRKQISILHKEYDILQFEKLFLFIRLYSCEPRTFLLQKRERLRTRECLPHRKKLAKFMFAWRSTKMCAMQHTLGIMQVKCSTFMLSYLFSPTTTWCNKLCNKLSLGRLHLVWIRNLFLSVNVNYFLLIWIPGSRVTADGTQWETHIYSNDGVECQEEAYTDFTWHTHTHWHKQSSLSLAVFCSVWLDNLHQGLEPRNKD